MKRREMELQADYAVKLQAGDQLTEQDLREITAVPHPNEHIRLMGPLSHQIFRCLMPRPVQIARIDTPLFVKGDEPCWLTTTTTCSTCPSVPPVNKSAAAASTRRPPVSHTNRLFTSGRRAPLASRWQMRSPCHGPPPPYWYSGPRASNLSREVFFDGDEARELAEDVNAALVAQAYQWVAARPGHPSFHDWTFPPPGPLIGVCDGGSVMSQQLRSAPPHRWQRLRSPPPPGKR